VSDKVRVGLLGVGGIAQIAHMPALRKAANIEWVAVCDQDADLARRFGDRYGVGKVYGSLADLLADEEVEAILNATRHEHHADTVIPALEAGKHVLVEKPLAESVADCEAILAAVERTGCKLQMGCMKRHDPAIRRAKEFIDEQMGARLVTNGWCFDSAYHGGYVRSLRPPTERGSAQRAPDPKAEPDSQYLIGMSVHNIDLMRMLGGEIVRAFAYRGDRGDGRIYTAALEYADGACGYYQLLGVTQGDWDEGVIVEGEAGRVHIRTPFPYFNVLAEVEIFDAAQQAYVRPAAAGCDMYAAQLDAFADAIRSDTPTTPDAHDGLMDQKVLIAIYESAVSGEPREVG